MVDFRLIFAPNSTEVNIGTIDICEVRGAKSGQKLAVKES